MKYRVTGEDMYCTVTVSLVVDSEHRTPSHAIEVAVSSSVSGTGFCRLDRQVAAGILGLDFGIGVGSAPECRKSLARFARVPIVGCVLL